MIEHIEKDKISNMSDIKTIPHSKYMQGYSRKPQSHIENMFGYQIIRSDVYECICDDNGIIIKSIEPGNYIVQPLWCYSTPIIYKNYKALVSNFHIPRDSKVDITPDYRYYAVVYRNNKKHNVLRFEEEIARELPKRGRHKKIKFEPIDDITRIYHDLFQIYHHVKRDYYTDNGSIFYAIFKQQPLNTIDLDRIDQIVKNKGYYFDQVQLDIKTNHIQSEDEIIHTMQNLYNALKIKD